MLRLAELPAWLRTTLGWLYFGWALGVTAFAAYVVVRALDFDNEVSPTVETVVLIAGLLVAPLLPFAQRLFFPGGGGVDFNVTRTREAGLTAKTGIENAATTFELPPLDSWLEGEGVND